MTKSQVLLTGFVIFLLVIGAVCPVMAAEERMSAQNHENDYNQQVNDDDRRGTEEKFSMFSHEGYDKKHHCPTPVPPAYTAIVNLTIDSSLINATPHWIFLAAGKTEQAGLLSYIRQANTSAKKKAQWSIFMMKSWMKYPVKYIKTEDGAILVPGRMQHKFSLTQKENQTFQDIERYIAEDMSKDQTEEVSVKWWAGGDGSTHQKFMTVALGDKDYPDSLESSAILAADTPDTFCLGSPIPNCQQINHGFVPIGILLSPVIIFPPTIGGLGIAPDNFGHYATMAKGQFALHDYNGAFKNMGYASHFITDLGNPFHTPNAQIIPLEKVDSPFSEIFFPNSQMIVDYKDLHDNYETMVAENWDKYYYENTDLYYILDPTYSAKVHGTYSWAANYPLVYNCYWHYVLNKNMNFSDNPVITAITLNRITESMKHTRGLVDYVTGGKPVVNYIQGSVTRGGTVDGASGRTVQAAALESSSLDPIFWLIEVPYGEDKTISVIPDSGYAVGDVVVDGVSEGAITSREFRNVQEDHTINVTFTEELPATPLPCKAGEAFNSSKYPQHTPRSDSMVFACEWDGDGRVFLSGDKDNLTGIYADDGFTVDTPNGIRFDAEGHSAQQHPPLELTSGMKTGSNTLTLIVWNYERWSMSYGQKEDGTLQTPYIIEVNDPSMIAEALSSPSRNVAFISNGTSLQENLSDDTIGEMTNSTLSNG